MPIWTKKMKHKNLLAPIKTGKVILSFGDIEIEKKKILSLWKSFESFFKDLDIEQVLV